jgi:hypothetical protein
MTPNQVRTPVFTIFFIQFTSMAGSSVEITVPIKYDHNTQRTDLFPVQFRNDQMAPEAHAYQQNYTRVQQILQNFNRVNIEFSNVKIKQVFNLYFFDISKTIIIQRNL